MALTDDARHEIDLRLETKERQFERAAVLAHGLQLDAFADDGVVTRGQPVGLALRAANHGGANLAVHGVRVSGFDAASRCDAAPLGPGGVYLCERNVRIPVDARLTDIHWSHVEGADRYDFEPDVPFGAPFRPTPFRATFDVELDGTRIAVDRPVRNRYVDDLFTGEKRMDLQVVPRFAVSMTPRDRHHPRRFRHRARGSRHGDQHRARRGGGFRRPRSARGMECGSRERARATVA